MGLINDLKRQHSQENILMRKRVDELNKKLRIAREIYDKQKKMLEEAKRKATALKSSSGNQKASEVIYSSSSQLNSGAESPQSSESTSST